MIKLGWISGGMIVLYLLRWLFLKRKEQPFALPLLFICLFMPKVKLLEISYLTTAGIRPDDLLALVLLLVAIMDPATYRNRTIKTGILILTVMSVLSLVSVGIGRMNGLNNKILLAVLTILRKYEYGAFALVGIYLARKLKDPYKVFIREFTVMSAMHMVIGILQVLYKVSYIVSGEESGYFFQGVAVSTFNGYYEYGQFLCFGVVIFLCDFLRRKNVVSLFMVPLSLGMLVLSNSRASLLVGIFMAFLILYLPVRERVRKRKLALGAYGVIGILAALTLLLTGVIGGNIIGRFGYLKIDEYLSYWKSFLARGNFIYYLDGVKIDVSDFDVIKELGYLDKITDWSAAVRLYKWGSVLDAVREYWVLGYGAGVTHVMDGNYLRLLAETGIFGTALFLFFYGYFMRAVYKARRVSKLAKPVFLMMVSILLNALLVDMFDASKPMEMMWFCIGAVLAAAEMKKEITRCR